MANSLVSYQIVDWEKNFEGAKSKTYNNKSTCQMPTKHGLGYKKLIRNKNGPALFGAWCSLVQVCSRHPKPRQGYCTDTGEISGNPYTSEDLQLMTDIPSKLFDELFEVALSAGVMWLRIPEGYHEDTTVPLHSDLDLNSDSNLNPCPTGADIVFDETKSRIGKIFKRRESTGWSDKEIKVLKAICKRQDVLEELIEIEKLYASPYEYKRTAIETFLNNWTGELDKSRNPANYKQRGKPEQIHEVV